MNELLTRCRQSDDYTMLVWHNPQETFDPNLGLGSRFRWVLVERGVGILWVGERRLAFTAPAVFCLDETERPQLEKFLEFQAQAIYFHPCEINSKFDFENIQRFDSPFSRSEWQDWTRLRPFLRRGRYPPSANVDLITAGKLAQLAAALRLELLEQSCHEWPIRARDLLMHILTLTGEAFAADVFAAPLPSVSAEVDPVILHLHAHYREKITIADLTRQFHTNRTSLNERFRQATGMPVMAYLLLLRLRLAASLLQDKNLSVSEAMRETGFTDASYFGRAFKKHLGCPPSEYRR